MTDLSDFNIWNAHKFTFATGGAAPAPSEVPEPGMLLLLAAAGIVLMRRYLGTTKQRVNCHELPPANV